MNKKKKKKKKPQEEHDENKNSNLDQRTQEHKPKHKIFFPDSWLPSDHNHKSTGICHKTINYPPQIQNNKPIHYPHKPIGANYPTQI